MKEYLEIIEVIPEFKPLVVKAIEGLKEYESEFKEIQQFVIKASVELTSGIYLGLIEKGIPPEHAVVLSIGNLQSIKENIQKAKARK